MACIALSYFQVSGSLSVDVHADLPPDLSGNHGSCRFILWVSNAAHFLSVSIQDVRRKEEEEEK